MVQAGAIMEKKCLQSYRSLILHSLQIMLTLFFILLALLVVNAWQGMKDLPPLVADLGVRRVRVAKGGGRVVSRKTEVLPSSIGRAYKKDDVKRKTNF